MFGGEESDVSIEDSSWECAVLHFSEARARRASAFLGFESKACERAIVRHLIIFR